MTMTTRVSDSFDYKPGIAVIFAAIVAATFMMNAQAVTLAEFTFDSDAEGWTGVACPNPGICAAGTTALAVEHLDAGGNPGGYIRTRDPSSETAGRVVPPASFSSLFALDQTLSFDVLVERNGGDGQYDAVSAPLVTIESPLGTLVYGITIADFPVIDGDWKHYDVPFTQDSAWLIFTGTLRALNPGEFATVFAQRTRLTIISEWLNDTDDLDTGGLDNIRLSAVPVPAALPLLLSALGVLGYRRRQI